MSYPPDNIPPTRQPQLYSLTLSERQARLTAEAVEFHSRWLAGQCDHLPDDIWHGAKDAKIDYWQDVRPLLLDLKAQLFPHLPRGQHKGIGWSEDDRRQQQSQIGYEIYKAILYEFHQGHDNVHSSPNMLHYSDQPIPKLVKLEPHD